MAKPLALLVNPRRALAAPALAAATLGATLTASFALTPAPAFAQEEVSEARLRKIEAEIRALQRKVFPGGDERFFEAQIQSVDPDTAARPSGPSTTAVTDILARLDAMELQLQSLTAIGEENSNSIGLLASRVDALEANGAPALPLDSSVAGEGEAALTGVAEAGESLGEAAEGAAEETADEPEEASRAMTSNLAAMGAAPSETPAQAVPAPTGPTGPTGPTPERLAAVQEIAKPQTGDAADDEYSYGYRLWNAGFYPEARQQLSKFVDTYPDHWRATYGRNLLGRAYLDDGKAEEAARWFLKNYQEDRTASRAPDSLLYLAESMIALDDTRRACIALAEFAETYPAVATGRLLQKYQANRAKVTCGG
ncbi:MAG: tetratricopeptide repeat protein [Pseudomonadota bacterium]